MLFAALGAAPAAAALASGPAAVAHAAPVRVLAVYHAPRRLQSRQLPARSVHRSAHRRLSHALVFAWPALGTITTPFIPGQHEGIDIGSLRSLDVTAAHAGRVIHVGYTTGFEGYGQIVDVEIEPGVETLYAHLAAMDVRIGQFVRPGERLGTAGCTGMCTGTHLHFEVRMNGTPVNPLRYLP